MTPASVSLPGAAGSPALLSLLSELYHAMGTPLTIVRTNLSLVRTSTKRGDHARPHDALTDAIHARAGDAEGGADDLARVLRAMRRGLGMRPGASLEPHRLDQIVRDALPRFTRTPRTVLIEPRLQKGAPVLVDARAIARLLRHLLVNATDASPPGGRVRVTVAVAGSGRLLSIADEGPGLPAALHERAFLPFVTTKPGALGLGLTFARALAEIHGGRLWHEVNPQGGATFHAWLPATPPQTSGARASSSTISAEAPPMGDVRFENAWAQFLAEAGEFPSPRASLWIERASAQDLVDLLSATASHQYPLLRNVIATRLARMLDRLPPGSHFTDDIHGAVTRARDVRHRAQAALAVASDAVDLAHENLKRAHEFKERRIIRKARGGDSQGSPPDGRESDGEAEAADE